MASKSKYTLNDVLALWGRALLTQVHTAIPGDVIKYDSTNQTVQVRIAIDQIIEGEKVPYPILDDIQVIFPRSGSHGVSFPLVKGDGVLLLFSEKNLEFWKTNGPGNGVVDGRRFDINDAVAIPGLFPVNGIMKPPPQDATELRGDKIFVGDPLQLITPVGTVGAAPIGTLPCRAPTTIPFGNLDLVTILETFMTLMLNAAYGGAPTNGGGGIDTQTLVALQALITDIGKLKV